MILSISKRVDMLSQQPDYINQIFKQGYIDLYYKSKDTSCNIERKYLNKNTIDGIVFFSKNPYKFLEKNEILSILEEIPHYYQITINAYQQDLEPNIDSKLDAILPFIRLWSDILKPGMLVWRYDPIFLSSKYTVDYHIESFELIAEQLSGYTDTCILGLLLNSSETMMHCYENLGIRSLTEPEMSDLFGKLIEIGNKYGIKLQICDINNPEQYGLQAASCIDIKRLERLKGYPILLQEHSKSLCNCAPHIDISNIQYCSVGCKYCYANPDNNAAKN